jgi:methylated-DNA-[protein]-cysteine S-methyltransferase
MIYTCFIDTPLGVVTVSAEEEALTGLWFAGQKHYPDTAGWTPKPDYPVFKALNHWLTEYFAGAKPQAPFKLLPQGTPFQKSVWECLLGIPYGEVGTYGGIARQLAPQSGTAFASARAVGAAVGHNPISVLIPCHRVVGATGNLTGYAGGLERKKALLRLEGKPL